MKNNQDKIYERFIKIFGREYDFHFCDVSEINEVSIFIDSHWKRGHILTKSKELMDWQYYDPLNNRYNFIIARHKATQEIHGIEGFISTQQYDHDIKDCMVWGAIWKTRDDLALPGLGAIIKQFREKNVHAKYSMEIGISEDAMTYSKKLNKMVFSLTPYYMLNPLKTNYHLIEPNLYVNEEHNIEYGMQRNISGVLCDADMWNKELFSFIDMPPYKSNRYYYNRYFLHPIYKYQCLVLRSEDLDEAIFYRIVSVENVNCIIFADYIGKGKLLAHSNKIIEKLMVENDAEYILFLTYSEFDNEITNCGFKNAEKDGSVVPVYFEPFLKKTVKIYGTTNMDTIYWPVFKGDADQDRPNIL